MIIDKDFIFIHIPKTAGRSITQAFCEHHQIEYDKHGVSTIGPKLPIHTKAKDVMKLFGSDFYNNALSFTVVRHPLDRLVSYYCYGQQNFESQFNSFNDFALWVIGEKDFDVCENWDLARTTQSQQIDWFVDYTLKFETLQKDWSSIKELRDISEELPVVNVSSHEHWSTYYSPELEAKVREYFKEDFIKYQYE